MKKILFQTKPIYKVPKLCSSECRLSYFSMHACDSPNGLMKAQTSGLTNRVSNSVSLKNSHLYQEFTFIPSFQVMLLF